MKSLPSKSALTISTGVFLFLTLILWRSPNLLLAPRFWAEEGVMYYAPLQDQGFFSASSLVVNGNFQLLTNWGAYFATWVPASYAAHVTTYLGLGVMICMVCIMGLIATQHQWSTPTFLISVAVLALLPHGYEIYLSTTNVQWVCSVCIFLMIAMKGDDLGKVPQTMFYGLALLSGLTGVCSAMLAPAFLLRRWVLPSVFHTRIGWLLSGCALFQLLVILNSPHPGRSFITDPFFLTFPLLLQSIWSPLLGAAAVDKWIVQINQAGWSDSWLLSIYALSLCVIGFSVVAARMALEKSPLPYLLLACWLGVSILNAFGALGGPWNLISGWIGGRYFFLGAVAFILLLGFAASSPSSTPSKFALFLLITMLLAGIGQVYWGTWKNLLTLGPAWQTVVEQCQGVRPCRVGVWPGGTVWQFVLTRP